MPISPGGTVTSGTISPSLGIGIGMGYVPAASAMPGTQIEIDVRGRTLPAEVAKKPLYVKEKTMSDANYPDDLRYNEDHDWARVEGDVATFGITWYAQDTLGEVVYFSPTAVGEDDHARTASTASSSRPRPCPR